VIYRVEKSTLLCYNVGDWGNFMKKILKMVLGIICWIIGLFLLYEALCSLNKLDSWGLGFTFYTLPVGIISILFLIEAINLTKDFINKK